MIFLEKGVKISSKLIIIITVKLALHYFFFVRERHRGEVKEK